MKQTIKLSESKLRNLIKEAIENVLDNDMTYIPTGNDSDLIDYAQEWKQEGTSFEEWKQTLRSEPSWTDKYSDTMLQRAWNGQNVRQDQ